MKNENKKSALQQMVKALTAQAADDTWSAELRRLFGGW